MSPLSLTTVLEVMSCLISLIVEQLDAGTASRVTEKMFLEPSLFGKLCVTFDECISLDGTIEQTDIGVINKLAKMKQAVLGCFWMKSLEGDPPLATLRLGNKYCKKQIWNKGAEKTNK